VCDTASRLVPCAAGGPGASGRQHQGRRARAGDRPCALPRCRPTPCLAAQARCHCERARRPCALAAGLRPLLCGWLCAVWQAPASVGGSRRMRSADTLWGAQVVVLIPCGPRRWWCCSGARASGTSRCARRSWSRRAPAPLVGPGLRTARRMAAMPFGAERRRVALARRSPPPPGSAPPAGLEAPPARVLCRSVSLLCRRGSAACGV
jgi:hypothetical protein